MRIKSPLLTAVIVGSSYLTFADKQNRVEKLPELKVVDKAETEASYHHSEINLGGLLKGKVKELPINSETLTAKLLEDRYTTSFYDAIQYTSGIFTGGKSPSTRTSGQFTMRGFSGSDTLLNGMAMPGSMSYFLDSTLIQNIDIFRGPLNGTTGGQTSSLGPYGCGGSINVVTKQPTLAGNSQKMTLGGTYSDKGTGRLTYDGDFKASESLGIRIPAAYELGRPDYLPGSYDSDYTFTIAPSALWRLGADTTLKLMTNYQRSDSAAYQGIPYLKGDFLVPTDTFYGNENSRNQYEMFSLQGELNHQFSRKLTLTLGGGYAKVALEREHWSVSSSTDYETLSQTYMAPLGWSDSESIDENYSLYSHLNYNLNAGDWVHNLTLGLDWLRKQYTGSGRYGRTASQDIRIPEYTLSGPVRSYSDESCVDRYGILLQDFIEIGRWRLLATSRIDLHESDSGNEATSVSPRLGITYLVSSDLSLYANYSYAEAPNFGYFDADGKELDDSWNAHAYEVGAKQRIGENLWINADIFEIQQNNTPESDGSGNRTYVSGAKNKSYGFEMSLSGELTSNWDMTASYTYTKYKDLDADIEFEKVPENSLALWTTYRIPGGLLQDLKLGLGWRYQSKTYTTFRGQYVGDDFTIDEAHVFDANAEYPLDVIFGKSVDARIQLGIKNLFDKAYVESARHGTENFSGAARTFTCNIIINF